MAKVGGFVLVFIIGIWLGVVAHNPGVEYRVRTETVTKTVEVPVAVPAHLPDSCLLLLDYAHLLANAGIGIDQASADQLKLLSDARLAILHQSMNQINIVDTRQRRLEDKTINHVATIAEVQPKYEDVFKECSSKTQTTRH